MHIFNNLFPIFAVIGLGMVLRWRNFLSQESTASFNRLAYFVALPAFLIERLSNAESSVSVGPLLTSLFAATLLTMVLGWGVSRWIVSKRNQNGVFVQAAFRGNLAFIGLPLILFVLKGVPESDAKLIETTVYVSLAPIVIFYNLAAVFVLGIYGTDSAKQARWKETLANIVFNPILLACLLGWLGQVNSWSMPMSLQRTLEVTGASAFPLALLGIGSQLATLRLTKNGPPVLVAAVLKCAVCPMIGWVIGWSLGMRGPELLVTAILCGVPTAVSSYVLADQMKGDRDLAASTVLMSTVFSLLTLSVLLSIGI